MSRRASVDLVGDPSSLIRSFQRSAHAADSFKLNLKELAVAAKTSVNAQLQAAAHRDARLRLEIGQYQRVAAAAKRGSIEQVSAARLAGEAQLKLSRSIGVTAHEARSLQLSAGGLERDIGRLSRGALAGSGAVRGLGRSLAFASVYFLGTAGIVAGIRGSIDAATNAKATLGQLTTAVRAAGLSYSLWRSQIDEALKANERLGFSEEESARAFTLLLRGTRDVARAQKEEALAADIARGRHIPLAVAANAVARAYGGQTGALRRLLPFLKAGVSAQDAIRQAQAAYAGSAERYAKSSAGAQDRLTVAIQRTKITIGTELLPTVTRLSSSLAKWLQDDRNQARVQRDVRQAVHDVGVAIGVAKRAFDLAAPPVRFLTHAVGGLKNELELLTAAAVAWKLKGAIALVTGFRTAEAAAGVGGAAGAVGKLRSEIGKLAKIGTVALAFRFPGLASGLAALAGLPGAIGAAAAAAILAAKGDQGPGPSGDRLLGQRPQQQFPLLRALGKSNANLGTVGQDMLATTYYDYRRGFGVSDAAMEAYLRKHFTKLQKAGVGVTRADLERSTTFATTTDRPGRAATGTPRRPRLPGTISGAARLGVAALSPMQRNQLTLSAASRTASTADDLAALRQQRELLATAIRTERGRLAHASTAGEAKKYADNLRGLLDQDASAFGQITSIEQQAASAAKAAAAKTKAAMARARAAAKRAADALERAYASAVADRTDALKRRAKLALAAPKPGGATSATAQPLSLRDVHSGLDPLIAQLRKDAKDQRLSASARRSYANELTSVLLERTKEVRKIQADAVRRTQGRQFAALGLGPSGHGQSPLRVSLKTELAQVKKALTGTLLDTSKNTHLLGQVGKVLEGQFGALTDRTRSAIRKLLDTLNGELKKGKAGFGPTGAVVSAEKWAAGLGLHGTALKEAQARFAQASAHQGRVPIGVGVQGTVVHINGPIHLPGVRDVDTFLNELEKKGRHQAPSRRGINAGRGRALP